MSNTKKIKQPADAFGERSIQLFKEKHFLQSAQTYAKDSFRFYFDKTYNHYAHRDLKNEILSGLTVSVMQVPESVAFSFVANVDPIIGLYSTFFMGLLTALLGGKPGMISGAAGAMAVVAADITATDGTFSDLSKPDRIELLFMSAVLVGFLQMICGFIGLARFVSMIPKTAMFGFMNGLAIIIFKAQLQTFQVKVPGTESGPDNELATRWLSLEESQTWMMLFYVAITMMIMHFFPKLTKALPASLVALIVCTSFEHGVNRTAIHADTLTVGDKSALSGALPTFHWPNTSWEWGIMKRLLPMVASLCFIGLIESVMTLQAVDIITNTPASTFRSCQECVAQGVGNLMSGLFGGMGGDAMIGQSTINILNGARGRLSGITAGFGMLITIVALSSVIELIPVAALAGILFMVVIHTFAWRTFDVLFRIPKSDSIAIILVTVLAVFTNLAIAVVAGVCFASLAFAWKEGKRMQLIELNKWKLLSSKDAYKSNESFQNNLVPNAGALTVKEAAMASGNENASGIAIMNANNDSNMAMPKVIATMESRPVSGVGVEAATATFEHAAPHDAHISLAKWREEGVVSSLRSHFVSNTVSASADQFKDNMSTVDSEIGLIDRTDGDTGSASTLNEDVTNNEDTRQDDHHIRSVLPASVPGQQHLQQSAVEYEKEGSRMHHTDASHADDMVSELTRQGKHVRVFTVHGQLFFASVFEFSDQMRRRLREDEDAVLVCDNSALADFSAIDAVSEVFKSRSKTGAQTHVHALHQKDASRVARAAKWGAHIQHLEPGKSEFAQSHVESKLPQWRRIPDRIAQSMHHVKSLGSLASKQRRGSNTFSKSINAGKSSASNVNGQSNSSRLSSYHSTGHIDDLPNRNGTKKKDTLLKTALSNATRPSASTPRLPTEASAESAVSTVDSSNDNHVADGEASPTSVGLNIDEEERKSV